MKHAITLHRQAPRQLRASRLSILLTDFGLTKLIIPPRLELTDAGVRTLRTRIFLFPWMKEEEHVAYRRIASVRHNRGFIWDAIILETSGGSNYLEIRGLSKRKARYVIEWLRERMAVPSGSVC